MTQTDVRAHYLLQEGTNHWTTAGLFVVDDALLQTICLSVPTEMPVPTRTRPITVISNDELAIISYFRKEVTVRGFRSCKKSLSAMRLDS